MMEEFLLQPVEYAGVLPVSPTIDDSHTSDGSGAGSFYSTLTDLTINTTYHVRAYATNSLGTAYGNEVAIYSDGTCS